MDCKITKFDEFKKIVATKKGQMRYDEKQWDIRIEEKCNYIEEGAPSSRFVHTSICHFKNIETNNYYEINLSSFSLEALFQISDDTFFLFIYTDSYILKKVSFRNKTINIDCVHTFKNRGCLDNFFLSSEDIFVCNVNSFNTFMYSISKHTQIDDINYLVYSNSETLDSKMSDSKFAYSRSIMPVYTDNSLYPTYLRIDYDLHSNLQKHCLQLLVDAKSLKPILLYNSLRKLYYGFRNDLSPHVGRTVLDLSVVFKDTNNYLDLIDLFFNNFMFQRNIKSTKELLTIIQDTEQKYQ